MNKTYDYYDCITREILETIEINDLVKCNDWVKPMRVVAVSENYIFLTKKHFTEHMYSIIEKKECNFNHNEMREGMYHCGIDDLVFDLNIDFDNKDECSEILEDFEIGEIALSVRRSIPLSTIQIKKERLRNENK